MKGRKYSWVNETVGRCYRCQSQVPEGGGRMETHGKLVRLHCTPCIAARKHLRLVRDNTKHSPSYSQKKARMVKNHIKRVGKKQLLKRIDQ